VAWGAAINIMPWEYLCSIMAIPAYFAHQHLTAMKGYVRYMLTWTDEAGLSMSTSQRTGNTASPSDGFKSWATGVRARLCRPDELVHTFYLWRCADYTSKTAKFLVIE